MSNIRVRQAMAAASMIVAIQIGALNAQDLAIPEGPDRFEAALLKLQERVESLEDQNSELKEELSSFKESEEKESAEQKKAAEEAKKKEPKYIATYDKGFVFKPVDPKKTPFELRVNGRMQFRYNGFNRDRSTYPTLAGPVPVETRNDFEIERGRIEFSGFMFEENLQY